eukprot:g8445.t1
MRKTEERFKIISVQGGTESDSVIDLTGVSGEGGPDEQGEDEDEEEEEDDDDDDDDETKRLQFWEQIEEEERLEEEDEDQYHDILHGNVLGGGISVREPGHDVFVRSFCFPEEAARGRASMILVPKHVHHERQTAAEKTLQTLVLAYPAKCPGV